jgi:uncharacterized protein (DUF58 family)
MADKSLQESLEPASLAKISSMQIIARLVVEGFIIGMHKSPHKGSSVEFAEHRQYVPGDDLRKIDWKVVGRTDRYYIKQFEEETNLRCYMILDASGSMQYGSQGVSKFRYASMLAGAMTYLMLQQRDAVGLVTFDDKVRTYIPPRSTPTHLRAIFNELEKTEIGGETSLGDVFHGLAEKFKKRGLIVIISDMFDNFDAINMALRHFRHKRHEVIVFHVLDQAELEFPFSGWTQFENLENSSEKIFVDPKHLRKMYLKEITGFCDNLRNNCWSSRIDYVPIQTTEPFDTALVNYLAKRMRK